MNSHFDRFGELYVAIALAALALGACVWVGTTCSTFITREQVSIHERSLKRIEAERITAEAHLKHGFVTTEGALPVKVAE